MRTRPAAGQGSAPLKTVMGTRDVGGGEAGEELAELALRLLQLLQVGGVRLLLLHERGQQLRLALAVAFEGAAGAVEVGAQGQGLARPLLQVVARGRERRRGPRAGPPSSRGRGGRARSRSGTRAACPTAAPRRAASARRTARPSCRGRAPAPRAAGAPGPRRPRAPSRRRTVASICSFARCRTSCVSRSCSVRRRTSSSRRSTSASRLFSWPRRRARSRSIESRRSRTRRSRSSVADARSPARRGRRRGAGLCAWASAGQRDQQDAEDGPDRVRDADHDRAICIITACPPRVNPSSLCVLCAHQGLVRPSSTAPRSAACRPRPRAAAPRAASGWWGRDP